LYVNLSIGKGGQYSELHKRVTPFVEFSTVWVKNEQIMFFLKLEAK